MAALGLIVVISICVIGIVQPSEMASQMVCAYLRQSSVRLSRLYEVPASSARKENTAEDKHSSERHGNDGGNSAEQNLATGELLDFNTTERCPKGSNFCYSLWQEDPTNKTALLILTQGCWGTSGEVDCKSSSCISTKKPSKVLNNAKFCCCSGDFCNANVTDGYVPSEDDSTEIYLPAEYRAEQGSQTVIVVITICVVGAVVTSLFLGFLYRCLAPHRPKPGLDSAHLMEAPQPQSPMLDLDSLKIQETIGRGRYGSVCKGSLNDHTVAVKIFAQHHHQYYANEKDIYKLFRTDYSFLPRLIGADERIGPDGRREWLLVLTHAAKGCLQDQLRKATVDWPGLCRMAQSITRALAFLHTEEKNKPCIAHRDLSSQNILVKDDGSCMLCDFGFAIRIWGSKYIQNGEEQHAETNSLADVGTLRYMAPEVLEGAVNLRDCESSLKQVDVYALGLIIWEIATRCSDLYQGMNVPDYKMPFEAEVGVHPSTEQMQVLVVRHKARPLFPDIWKDSNPAVRALKETIEDCWDQDAEARLTAVCIEERLNELPVLWERHKAGISVSGVSPTVNPTSTHMRVPPLLSCVTNGPSFQSSGDTERSETTAETLLLSPNSPIMPNKNTVANNIHLPMVSVPLQPHQGRNPCLERNLMVEPAEQIAVSGNHTRYGGNSLLEEDSGGRQDKGLLPYQVLLGGGDSGPDDSTLVLGDLLAQTSRTCHPIPYVQNAVHVSSVIPKQPNLPGNGHKLLGPTKKPEKRLLFSNMFRRPQQTSEGSLRRGLRSFFERKPRERGEGDPGSTCNARSDSAALLEKFLVNTEVQMVEGGCRVRPVLVLADAETAPLLQSKDINDNCREAEEADRILRPTSLPLRTCLPSSKGSAPEGGGNESAISVQQVCTKDA